MTYIPPLKMGHEKPQRVQTNRQRALYTCKAPWEFIGSAGEVFKMPCRRCGSCHGNRKNDLVGKMIAESLTCYDVWVMTLTYDDKRLATGAQNGAEQRLPEHIRAMIHSLRMQGQRATGHRIDLSYFAVYETGERNGRGHWHLILFWKTDMPKETLAQASVIASMQEAIYPAWMPPTSNAYNHPAKHQQIQNNPKVVELRGGKKAQQYWDVWPHGRITVDSKFRGKPTHNVHGALEYCVKYVTKQKQRYLMSHNVGKAFFMELIAEHVRSGIPVNDLTYTFADQQKLPMYNDRLREKRSDETGGSYRAKPRRRVYQIQGVMRDRCLRYAVRLHRQRVKQRYRLLLPRKGLTVGDARDQIRDAMSLPRIGSELVVRQWERMRFNAQNSTELLARLAKAYDFEAIEAETLAKLSQNRATAALREVAERLANGELADIAADLGHSLGYRTKNMRTNDGPQYWQPQKETPALSARLRALSK